MRTGRTAILTILIIGTILLDPLSVAAQTTGTSSILQRFDPNATFNLNGNSFGGITFSGVGGAIAACTNAGGNLQKLTDKWTNRAVGGIKQLFNAKPTQVVNSNAQGVGQMNSSGVNLPNLSQGQIDQHITSVTGQAARDAGVQSALQGSTSVPVTDTATEQALSQANKREECLDAVAYAVAKSLLQQVTEKTLSLVNTGNFGNPYYVRDLPSYLRSISDQKIANFLDRIPNENPIFGNAIRSIITEQVTGISDGLLDQAMNTPQGQAYQRFQEDFSNGGWEAFLDPNNNPLDAIFNAADDLNTQIAQDQQETKDELQRNNGFLDMKRCVEYKSQSAFDASVPGFGSLSDWQKALQEQLLQSEEPECVKWETVTPGSVISAQINEVTTSPVRILEQSDRMANNIDQVFGSFFDQLLNMLFSNGLGSLRGNSYGNTFTLGSGGSNIVVGSNGQPINTANAYSALGYNPSTGKYASTQFDISRPQQVRTVLAVQYDYLNRVQDAQIAEQRLIPVLGALDYCIPGPNPTWQDGLDENIQTYTSSLRAETTNGSGADTGATIGSAAGAIAGSFIPGIGTAIGAVIGNTLGKLLGGLIDNGKPHALIGAGVQFYDKVTGEPINERVTVWREPNRSPEAVYNNLTLRLNEVLDEYKKSYTVAAITNAFVSVDAGNATYAKGFATSALDETAKLPVYDQAIAEIDSNYTTAIANTKDAIKELESIRSEVNDIVATAKARYIAQQQAAGTPVNQECLNKAYVIYKSPIVVDPRVESDTPSPYLNQSKNAAVYFYNHL